MRLTHRVRELSDKTVGLRLDVVPLQETRNGVSVTPAAPTTIDLQIDRFGRAGAITRVGSLPASVAEELQAAGLLHEALPDLPRGPIASGDRWTSPLNIAGEKTQIQLTGSGRFLGYAFSKGRSLARFDISRSGSVSTSQRIGRAEVTLPGTVESRTHGRIDVDKGVIVQSDATSHAEFDLASGGSGLTGSITVGLRSHLELERDQLRG